MSNTFSTDGRTALGNVWVTVLWVVFFASVVTNTVTSFHDRSPVVPLVLALSSVASGVALFARYRRRRGDERNG